MVELSQDGGSHLRCYDFTACEIIINSTFSKCTLCTFHKWHVEAHDLPYKLVEGHTIFKMDGTVHTPKY